MIVTDTTEGSTIMLQAGQLYTFHIQGDPSGPHTYVGRFQTYDADDQGRPTLFTIEQRDGTVTSFVAGNVLSIDHGDTWTTRLPGFPEPGTYERGVPVT